jgi:ADP-ribose pyrophosphatase YjhB (NUDIX family)
VAKRKKSEKLVASVAAFDEDGKLLFGLRSDMQKWVLPGGHLEEDEEGNPEDPRKGAVRELREETGLKPLSLQYLGHGVVRRLTGNVRVFCFKAKVAGKPHGDDDPDQECQTFRFVDVKNGIPDDINENMRDRNNVTLRLLGLQEGEVRKHEVELSKGSGGDINQIKNGPPPPSWQMDEQTKENLAGWVRQYGPDQVRLMAWRNIGIDDKVSAWNHHDWLTSRAPDESDADFMRRSPKPEDRAMALKLPSTEKRHLLEAARSGDASSMAKYQPSFFDHPLFDREVAKTMLESNTLPHSWKQSAIEQKKDPIGAEELEPLIQKYTPFVDPEKPVNPYGLELHANEQGLVESMIEHPSMSADQAKRLALYGDDNLSTHLASKLLRRDLPPSTLDEILKDGTAMMEKAKLDNNHGFRGAAMRSVVRNKNLPEAAIQHLFDFADKHRGGFRGGHELEMHLAGNPALTNEHMKKLLDPKRTHPFEAATQLAVLKNPKLNSELVGLALKSPLAAVRKEAIDGVSSSLHTPEQLSQAAQDEDPMVRKAVAGHPSATPELLQKIHDDFWNGISPEAKDRAMKGDLSQQAAINAYMSTVAGAIAHNSNVSDELFRHIATHYMPSSPGSLAQDMLSNPYPTKAKLDALVDGFDNSAKLADSNVHHFNTDGAGHFLDGLTVKNYDNKNLWRSMLTRDHLNRMLRNRLTPTAYKSSMLRDEELPWAPEDLDAVVRGGADSPYDSGNERMRANAIRNSKVPLQTVRDVLRGATPPSNFVMQEAVRHPGLTSHELFQLAGSTSHPQTLHNLMEHPNAGSEHVTEALKENPVFAADYLRHGAKVGLEHVKQGLADPNFGVRSAAVGHPLAPLEDVRRIAHDPNEHYDTRVTALNSGRLDEEDLVKLASAPPRADPQRPGVQIVDPMVSKAKELLAKEAPDTVFTEKVGPRLGVGKVRKIRDLITSKKGRLFMHQKDLPPGDWSAGRGPDGNIHASKLQEHIDKQQPMAFNVSHAKWEGAQRHSEEPSKVFQLNLTSDHVRKLKQAGVYNAFRKMQEASTYSSHPVARYHGVGWVRWTGNPRQGIFVDEVQSDFGQSFVRQAAAQAAARGMDTDDAVQQATNKYGSEEDFKKISQILFNGKHPNEILHESFQQWLRDQGHHNAKVQVHTVESKAPISLGRPLPKKCKACGKSEDMHSGEVCSHPGCNHPEDVHHAFVPYNVNPEECASCSSRRLAEHHPNHPFQKGLGHAFEPGEPDRTKAPGHFNVTYHDVPKKMGAEPSTYGKLKTQTGTGGDREIGPGAPTWEMKVRKAEKLIKALGWLPAFRHPKTGAVISCHEGYHDLNVLPPGDMNWDTGFVNPEGVYHTREQTQQVLKLNGNNSGALHAAQTRKFEPELWLAQHRLVKKIKASDLKPVSRYHDGPLGEVFVDHSKEFEAHPGEHQGHVDAFRAAVIDHPDHVKRGKTGTRESSNSTGKVVYDVNHDIGSTTSTGSWSSPTTRRSCPGRAAGCISRPGLGGDDQSGPVPCRSDRPPASEGPRG